MVLDNIYHLEAQRYSTNVQLKQALSGAATGFCTRALTHPLEVLKIRFQLQVEPVGIFGKRQEGYQSKYTSLNQACKLIYREEGVLAFWKGHNAGQLYTMSYTIVQFWSYEQIRVEFHRFEQFQKRHHLTIFLSGALSGCIGSTMAMPFDVIRTRLVGQDHTEKSRKILVLFPYILREQGISGLFRGLSTTLIQIGPLIGSNFLFYNYFYNKFEWLKDSDGKQTIIGSLVSGASAGILSKLILYPLDVVKKRIQLQGFTKSRKSFGRNSVCISIINCMKTTLQNEGISGLYKGLFPTMLKSGLATSLYFSFYDMFNILLNIN